MKQRIETIDDSPILIIKRDEPIAKVEEVKVVNNVAILSECPYHFTKVRIKDMFEIPEDVYRNNKEIKENQYVADYKFGFITFSPIMEGRTLTVEYDGTGTVLIPSSRIYDTGRKDIIVTLQEMIDGGRKAIEAYGNIDNVIKKAEEEYAKINTSIEEGREVNNDLNITIINAKDINKVLEGNIYKANNINNALNGSITSGTNKIQEMDDKISEVDNNESIRKSNEEERRNSEDIRKSNENTRKFNETTRENNEEIRVSTENRRVMAELLRKENEDNRKSDENVRIDNENKRTQSEVTREANEKDRQNTHNKMINAINDFSICEQYNENKEYKKLNRVTYNGSLYECKYGNVGILPTDKNCWICIAEKGKDGRDGLGSGDMHTSIYDKNGNGIVDVAEVAESVEWEDVKNKPDLSEIGKVKSVNGKTGEVKLTAEDIEMGRFGQTVKDAILDNSIDTEEIASEMHNKIKAINLQMENITKYDKKTHAELSELKNNNKLEEGKKYLLTDYRTKYKQPDTNVIKEMEVEELILTASSNNTFEPVAYSFKYPQDTIWYDFDNNKCEDNKTPRNGFITRRYDHISGNDCPQDWRTMLWARWCPDENQYYKNGKLVDYEIWEQGQEVDTGVVYKANDKLLIAKYKGVPYDAEDMYIFDNVYYDISIGILRANEKILTYSDFVEDEIRLKLGKLHERKTFNEGCAFNIIKSNTTEHVLHNNVFGEECKYNKLGSDCYDNTFEKYNYYNILENECYNNLLQWGSNLNYFTCTSYHNVLADECENNYFSNRSNNNILGYYCYNNFINNSSSNSMFFNNNNNVLSNCNNNVFYNNSENNIIMNCNRSKISAHSKNLFVKQLRNKNMLGIQELKNPNSCNVIEPNKNGDYVYSVINANNNIEFITIP